VNFFGHAAVASWSSAVPVPGLVLGAMLPDFASMTRGRVDGADDPTVAAGIDLHHRTDAVFHQLPVVTGLMRELDDHLGRRLCARGPRRAVAHIGVELLLDGVLLDDPNYRAAYLAGLGHDAAVRWREPETADRFATLLARLRARGIPDDLQRPDAIATRLARILADRPLLAASPDDLRAIHAALVAFKPRLEVAADTVMRAMRGAFASALDAASQSAL